MLSRKLLVILGPTATGKTDIALGLAKKFNGELVSGDSRQVYVGLDIGTGKIPGGKWKMENGRWKKGRACWEIAGIKIWMYDVANPKRQYNVACFVKDANRAIDGISRRGKLPILVGGTGLYIRTLLYGLRNASIPVNKSLRKELEKLTLKELQSKLKIVSSARWNKLNQSDRQNPRRLIRSLEVLNTLELESMYPYMETYKNYGGLNEKFDILKIGLTAPRDILYKKVDKRILTRISQGMVQEAERLKKKGLSLKRMRQLGLEYGVLADYLEGKIKTKKGLVPIFQGKIHGFVRRQLTFFKKEKKIFWFNIVNDNFYTQLENKISKWYDPD